MAYTGSYQRADILLTATRSKGWEIAWKVYFFVLVVISVGAPLAVPELYVDLNVHVMVDTLLTIMSLVGLFGFAWKERIASQTFWKIFFVVALLAFFALGFIPPTPGMMEAVQKNALHVLAFLIPGFLFFIPTLAALFLYGFRSKEIWAIPEKTEEHPKKR